jgi:ABC-type maltose transport system permease subunit
VVALVAFYLLLQQIGKIQLTPWLDLSWFGLNSLGGVILIYAGGALGANAWLMKGYFDTIPREIDESAHVDGASHWTTFTQIILPLIRPILAVVALLAFIGTFNDYLIPRVLLKDRNVFTLAVGLTTFLDNQFSVNWGVFAAGALIGTLPIIILFLVLQTQIISGLSAGAVKG